MHRAADFRCALRRGRRVARGAVVVHLANVDDVTRDCIGIQSGTRVGFAVSRAVGGAVVRNRVKRRLRVLVSDRIDALPAGARVLLVVRALPAAATATFSDLAHDLDAALTAAAAAPRRPVPAPAGAATGSVGSAR